MKWEEWEKDTYQKNLQRVNEIENWGNIENEIFRLFPNAKKQYLDKDINKWVSYHRFQNQLEKI